MKGIYKVKIRNAQNEYNFTLMRNITILQGDSGKGKTTLFNIIKSYNERGKKSGAHIECPIDIIAVDFIGDNILK